MTDIAICVNISKFHGTLINANFQKAGRLHSCLIALLRLFVKLAFIVLCIHKTANLTNRLYQPLCVSFYYIIYIVNVCFFEWNILQVFIGANFQKAGRLHSCLIMLGNSFLISFLFYGSHKKQTRSKTRCTNPCVFLFIILYIYSKYMFFWVMCFTSPIDANFQKAGRLHSCLIPAPQPCFATLQFLVYYHKPKQSSKTRSTNPCVFLFIILYIYSKRMYFWVTYFTDFRWRQFSKSWTPSFLPYSARNLCYFVLIFV